MKLINVQRDGGIGVAWDRRRLQWKRERGRQSPKSCVLCRSLLPKAARQLVRVWGRECERGSDGERDGGSDGERGERGSDGERRDE